MARPESQAQIHTDIKPVNILCFNDGMEHLSLKLADFGEAKSIGPESTVEANRVPHVKTYRPPEYSPGGHISPNYDVWCLGCLFLEFVTWALKGWDGIKEFSKAREDEREAPEVTGVEGQLMEDTFFKKTTQSRYW
ncbi:G-type lectin S-receptor-like serine/threonine-protein kinase SD1-1 [Cytospora mali]|uniref:G-type lectin S-receptor-like serine/threonine-protein kinase SD1-1 n=1 Tax=Cytospora mali TaxID=578113 RepID=A0A194WDM0_CYTMA|nr:G-type lectin S-receptor-like serine/threonine-protein kinase SD1-1 [Valsa mali]